MNTPKDLARRMSRLTQLQKMEMLANGARAYENLQLGKWDLIVNVSAMMAGEMADWPHNIQEGIHEAVEKQCKVRAGYKAKVVYSACKRDEEGTYIQLIVMEMPVFSH